MPKLFDKKSKSKDSEDESLTQIELQPLNTRGRVERADNSDSAEGVSAQASSSEVTQDSDEELFIGATAQDSAASRHSERLEEFDAFLTRRESDYGPVVEARKYLKDIRLRAKKDVNFLDGDESFERLFVQIREECDFWLWCFNLRAMLKATDNPMERKCGEQVMNVAKILKNTSDVPVAQLSEILRLTQEAIHCPDSAHIAACREGAERLPTHQIENKGVLSALSAGLFKTARIQQDPLKKAVEDLSEHLSIAYPPQSSPPAH